MILHVNNKDDLINYWTLNQQELVEAEQIRGAQNRILFTIQLCHVKLYGRFLPSCKNLSFEIIEYLAQQLRFDTKNFIPYYTRKATENAHHQRIKKFLAFKDFDNEAETSVQIWIHENISKNLIDESQLYELAENFLKLRKYLLPSKKSLEKQISSFKRNVYNDIYVEIAKNLNEMQQAKINQLIGLEQNFDTMFTLGDLKKAPPEPSAKTITNFLDQYRYLAGFNFTKKNFTPYCNEVINKLSRIASCYTAKDYKRFKNENKRYALATAFIYNALRTILDHIVDMNDNMLTGSERRSKNQFKKEYIEIKQKSKDGIKFAAEILEAMLSESKHLTLKNFVDKTGMNKIFTAITSCKAVNELDEEGATGKMMNKYGNLRKYMPQFFSLDFKASVVGNDLMKAIWIIRDLNDGKRKTLPDDAPVKFISKAWASQLYKDNGKLCRKTWEMGVYFSLKKAIRAGNIFLADSNKHCGFLETIANNTNNVSTSVFPNNSNTFDVFYSRISKDFKNSLSLAENNMLNSSFVYFSEDGSFKIKKEEAIMLPPSTINLKKMISSQMPVIRIEKLLAEVDAMVNFKNCFNTIDIYENKQQINPVALYAALIAHGTNIGLYGMGQSAEGITVDMLRHASKWLIREDTLKRGNEALINAQIEIPVSKYWGDGTSSSSDGQRFGIQRSSNLASFYPRYFGYYDKAINIYTHTSDVFTVFGTKVISCGSREATYVIDAILQNNSALTPIFHSTDTHGYTEIVFGLSFLLDLTFMPRIKDLSKQRLYWIKGAKPSDNIIGIFHDSLSLDIVKEEWGNLMNIIDSLKSKKFSASWFLEKLSNRGTSDRIYKAFSTIGKIVKTIYILRYLCDNVLRNKVGLQLNRGESRHQLAKHLFFANQGVFKTNDYEEIMNKASCLSFLSNAISLWNSSQIQTIVTNLQSMGNFFDEKDLSRISPLWFKDVLVHGSYDFTEKTLSN